MKFGLRCFDIILIILFFYLFVLQIQSIWPFTIDDMFISLRYAKHWVSGDGLLWNVRSPPVEGYSNFSFVLLGALVLFLKGDPVFILKMAGVLGLFFTSIFIYLISRFWFDKRESLLPCLGLLLYKGQIIWATSGLETTVYEMFICGSVYFCFRGMGYQLFPGFRGKSINHYFIFSGLFLSFAGMTRPEAPVLMILFFVLICWDRPKEQLAHKTNKLFNHLTLSTRIPAGSKHYRSGVLFFIITLMMSYGPYFLWRFNYFGFLFPNPVYCKGLTGFFSLVLDINYLRLIWPLALLVLPACIKSNDKRHYFLWLPSFIYLMMLIDADPVVAFENRLFLPSFVLLLPLVLQSIQILIYSFWEKRDYIFTLLFYLSSFIIAFLTIPAMSLADYRYFCQNPIRGEALRIKVVNWLNTHTNGKERVVLGDSGLIPFKSDLNFIDSYCLNNLAMGHDLGKDRYQQFSKGVLREKPEIIILTSLMEDNRIIYTPSDGCLKKLLNKNDNYKFREIFVSDTSNSKYRYEIYTHS